MSDRAYTRFTLPMSVLANEAMTEAVRSAFGIPLTEFQRVILSDPVPDEAAGYDSFSVRLIDGRPALVYEDEDANYGGTAIEEALCAAHVPFIQVNGAGHEYGPASTVFDGETSELIRLGHDLVPIAAIGLRHGTAMVDPMELADLERYHRLRSNVALWPANVANQ